MSEIDKDSVDDDDHKGWETPGIILRRVRRERGLDADDVCNHLGLTQRALKALEADEYDKLPAAVYVRGYIRRYCDLLDIRVEPVLNCFESYYLEMSGDTGSSREPGAAVELPTAKQAMLLLLTLILAALVLWAAGGWSKEGSGDGASTKDAGSLSAADVSSIAGIAPEKPQQPTVEQSPAVTGDDTSADYGPSAADAVEPDNTEANPAVVEQTEIQLHFVHDSWVEVSDSRGKMLLVNLQKAGTELSLAGAPPFDVRLGYGPGVTISYQGRPVAINSDSGTYAARLLVGK